MADEFLTSSTTHADVATGMQPQPALDPAVTLAEYAASTAQAPEPVGRTLRAIAERDFTGEIEFALGTGVLVYADGGHPYYAERVGDAPLGERLVTMGVLSDEQLAQGMIRVGDVEHLGRLFDRDSSIDRAAVIAATELITDELLTDIAGGSATIELTAYRHHRSGVHRWFVGPGRTAPVRPVDAVSQLDRAVFDQVPDVSGPSALSAPLPAPMAEAPLRPPTPTPAPVEPEMRIEWDHPVPVDPDLSPATAADDVTDVPAGSADSSVVDAVELSVDDVDIDAELRSFDADRADWSGGVVDTLGDVDALGAPLLPPMPAPARPDPGSSADAPVAADETIVSDPARDDLATEVTDGSDGEREVSPTPDSSDRVEVFEPSEHSEADGVAIADMPLADAGIELVVARTDELGPSRAPVPADDGDVALGEFTIVWPDGSEESTVAEEPPPVRLVIAPEPVETAAAVTEQVDVAPADQGMDARSLVEPLPLDVTDRGDDPMAVVDDDEAADQAVDEEAGVAADDLDGGPTPTADLPAAADPLPPAELSPDAAATPSVDGDLGLSLPSLQVDSIPEPDAEVPDDVAAAVRRALAAIERASTEPDGAARLRVGSVELPDFSMPKLLDRSTVEPARETEPRPETISVDAQPVTSPSTPATSATAVVESAAEAATDAAIVPAVEPVATHAEATADSVPLAVPAPASAGSVFAPPTADMAAEAVYARAAAAMEAATPEPDDLPEPGQASVVFVDAQVERDERKGALKRLIGSLRRK